MEKNNYKILTILLLGIFIFELAIIFSQNERIEKAKCGGILVTMYSDLKDYGVKVYYQSCVKRAGISESNLIKVCDTDGGNCRKPYTQEIEKDRYIPQSQVE